MTSDATQPIRCFTCIGSRRTLNPATVASPSVMSVRPVSNLIIVVLPAPFGPSRPKTVPEATFRVTWSTAVSLPYTFVRFSVTIALSVIEVHRSSLRKDPQNFLSHLDHDPAEFVRLLRGHLAHVRPQELPGRSKFSEERRPLRTDGGLESAEALLNLLAAAPQVRLAFAGNPVGLATFLAAHGEVSLPQESPQGRIDGARTRLVEPVVPFLDRLDDLVPVHRAFLEQVQDETFEVALPEEMEEPPELLRGTHEASSRRRYQRSARTLPAIAYPAKTRREVAGSGMKPTSPPPGPGDDEGRDRRGTVVQRQDRGADDQAGNDLAEDQNLAPHRVREEEVPGPLLVLRHERVRREQDSAEDDQEPREGRERRDEGVRSGGVLDAEGGRQPDEEADDEPEEDQHPQEAAAADVLANLVGGDRDDLGQGARRHRRSDSWMRSR